MISLGLFIYLKNEKDGKDDETVEIDATDERNEDYVVC